MIVRLLPAALAAGLIAGMAMTPVPYAKVIALLMQTDTYENGLVSHAHAHAHAPVTAGAVTGTAHHHARFRDTVLANPVAEAGFAMMFAAAAFPAAAAARAANIRGLLFGAAT